MASKLLIASVLQRLAVWVMPLLLGCPAWSQSDNCNAAATISIANKGYGLGTFTSPTIDLSGATVQAGESFAPAVAAAGQTAKSIWYRFSLPTTRSVRISLAQSGAIAPGDVGLTVYKTSACLPATADIYNGLVPLTSFGSTFQICVKPGDYLVQVSAKSSANGPVFVQVETRATTASYDFTTAAYDFGTLLQGEKVIGYAVDCQSTEDETEACPSLPNYQQFNKSTWHVFTTPANPGSVVLTLSYQFNSGLQKFGLALYEGDIRRSAVNPVGSCELLQSDAPKSASRLFKCDAFMPNTVYSLQLFFDQNFNDNVQVGLGADTLKKQNYFASVCSGGSYTLPWGSQVSAAGIYSDTLKTTGGCDSLIQTVTLVATTVTTDSSSAGFCRGSTYTLPWGQVVSSGGLYRDTVRAAGGCDSLVRIINLGMDSVRTSNDTVSICQGSSYTLPWGAVATGPGTYSDTLRYSTGGCDSLVRIVEVKVLSVTTQSSAVAFCSGASYTLPWGLVVSVPGQYRDTLHAASGCDSLIQVVDVKTNSPATELLNARICPGGTYTLPWGTVVALAGIYTDTLRSIAGCDSIIRTVSLSSSAVYRDTADVRICAGQSFTLPSGGTVSAAGVYADTLQGAGGCDSVVHLIRLTLKSTTTVNNTVTICPGASYTLPWGSVVSTPGTYRDTLPYSDGCDSLVRVVSLSVNNTTLIKTSSAFICTGQAYTLPWGAVVYAAGLYRDTVRGSGGCDSLVQTVQLTAPVAARQTLDTSICSGGTYILPWGGMVSASGTYSDTLRTTGGCDSLVQFVNLRVIAPPVLRLSKSNDIDCVNTSARLSASGGTSYRWSPVTGLTDPDSPNPVASPTVSTLYYVQAATAAGCPATDSIRVYVNTGNVESGYWVANAFTPNNDGKNDCFGIQYWGAVRNLTFLIYDRWGEVVFQTSDASRCWDGRYKGASLPTGTFVYLIEAQTNCGLVKRRGTVTLIR